ncbi:acyltransferase family protein [Agreia pratensis]|uniref:acyltransferase family protein n=1 Tax=Agreia pratensis TaxID=150121 RepID=UPI00188D2D4B|nr:acyltransferase family protein [Agreia pratensis]MBF4633028.1 acyltransferase family protein [Agreia pratensis]
MDKQSTALTSAQDTTVRLPWLDVAKGLSIVSVVLFHAGSAAPSGTTARTAWQVVDLGLFTFIMPLFFLVSGLVMGAALTLSFRAFLRKRVWPIAYLFVVWTAIYAVINLATKGTVGGSLLDSLTLQTVLWYLAALGVYMLIAWLTRKVPSVLVIAAAAVIAVPPAIFFPFDGWGLAHGPHFMVFFLLGCRLASSIIKRLQKATWRDIAVLGSVAVIVGAIAVAVPALRAPVYALTPLISVPLVLIVSMWISRRRSVSSAIEKLGKGSLGIFVIHQIVLSVVGLLLVPLLSPIGPFQWLLPLIAAGLAIGVAMLAWTFRARYPLLFRPPRAPGPLAEQNP